jgi:hypothetical protein
MLYNFAHHPGLDRTLIQDPRCLWRRYLLGNPWFIYLACRQLRQMQRSKLTGGYPLLLANLYGPRDNVDLRSSHGIPALSRTCLVFGFRARTSLFDGLRRTVAWYRARQGGQTS